MEQRAGHQSCDGPGMRRSLLRSLSWLGLSLATATAMAADGEKKAFDLPDNSKLELAIPAGWKDELKEKSIALSPREGAPFQVLLTPIAVSADAPGFWRATQGMLLVGDVVVAFSILTNDAQEKVRDQALAMLKGASHIAR
jgi:hypothetical protein